MSAVIADSPAAEAAARRLDLLARFDGRAPRYTSYPTALQFSGEVDGEVYGRWLAALDPSEPVSLYAHIPFCDRLCWYCGCNTRAVRKRALIGEYVDRLLDELALVEAKLPGRLPVGAVHLGGGTPNMLSPDDLELMFQGFRRVFQIADGAEIAAELDPSVLSPEWARAAAAQGLNRASVGVQNLSPQVQAAVNRIEPFSVVEQAVGWLREAGVGSINLDLMYGLPKQQVADVEQTLEQVLTLRPDRIAMFGYAHVPWAKAHQKLIDTADLADAAGRLAQSEAAAAVLASHGYVRIGLDHYALPQDALALGLAAGTLRRNFQGYTTDPHPTLIGLGASAIGRLPQGYVQNLPEELAWRTAVTEGRLPVKRGVALTDEDRFRAELIERLMCDLRLDMAAVCARHGRSPAALAPERARLSQMAEEGVVALDGDRIALTEVGRPFVRVVARVFDQRSGLEDAFSRVV